MSNLASSISRTGGVICFTVLLCVLAVAQDTTKNYKDLDKDAMKLFKEGKYDQSCKIWHYIHYDYPRAEFRDLRNDDPRFIAWQVAFHTSIIREGYALKQARLQSPDPMMKAKAEAAYTEAVEAARVMMGRSNLPKATQDKLIKEATKPLINALKPEGKKLSPPDGLALAEASKKISDVYGQEIAKAKTAAARKAVANKLLEAEDDAKQSPALRWALVIQARDFAAAAGDLELSIKAVEALSAAFDANVPEIIADTAEKCARATPAPDPIPLIDLAARWGTEQTRAGNYKLATRLFRVGSRVAYRSPATTPAGWRFDADVFRAEALEKALATATSEDAAFPTQPSQVARFKFFKTYDPAGLTQFVETKDKVYSEVAKLELKNPTTPAGRVAIANAWIAVAENAPETEQRTAFMRATHWYRQAMVGLGGVEKERAAQQLAKAQAAVLAADKKSSGFLSLVGNWSLRYADGTTWDYAILADGEVTISNSPDRNEAKCYLVRKEGEFFLICDSGKVIERIRLQGDRITVARFLAKDYPATAHGTGTGNYRP